MQLYYYSYHYSLLYGYLGSFKPWTIINNTATNAPVHMAFHMCKYMSEKLQAGWPGPSMRALGIGNLDRDYLGECLLPYASMLSKLPFLANGIEGKMQSHCTFILH